MSSHAFRRALTAAGYLTPGGKHAPGMITASSCGEFSTRIRPALLDDRVGLRADAAFSVHESPTTLFKDAGTKEPTSDQIHRWHEAAWNVGVAPLLWIVTPTQVQLYDCYGPSEARALETFPLDSPTLETVAGRLATETGAFWSSAIGQKIDRHHRVDRELLVELEALERELVEVPTPADEQARDFAQRLIGRCLFTSYVIERKVAQPSANVAELLSTPRKAFELFRWLRTTFDGDLFPIDDLEAEKRWLNKDHLRLVRRFFVEGQPQKRVFQFRFDAIPIDLISAIYQQFARSSAKEEAYAQSLHYTPIELVHFTLDPVFEKLPPKARVIDLTCGSGVFLVEALRRLVWKRADGGSVTRKLVRDVLRNQIRGIDINESALRIAAFSLHLAELELCDEPARKTADLKFDRIIGRTLHEADALKPSFFRSLGQFDAVVGNPPWTFDSRRPRRVRRQGSTRPRRSPDQEFLKVAANLAGSAGRIGMIMKASPFFAVDKYAVEARNKLIKSLTPVALVNLSALRHELFEKAAGPPLVFFARCALMPDERRILVGSVPWMPEFKRSGIFTVGPGDFRSLPLHRVMRTPGALKATALGSARDGWLVEKLASSFPSLSEALAEAGLEWKRHYGQGFQVSGGTTPSPPGYARLRVVTPDAYRPLRVPASNLEPFTHRRLHRPRNRTIYRAPLVLCPEGSFSVSAEPGRYSVAVHPEDALYTESFYGISFSGRDKRWAYALSAILNSNIATFQLAMAGSTWGIERAKVEGTDLLSLRVPHFRSFSSRQWQHLLEAEAELAVDPAAADRRRALDEIVADVYELDADERVLVGESIERARTMIFESQEERRRDLKIPGRGALASYARAVVTVVNRYLRARGRRHLIATLYDGPIVSLGLTVVRFSMATGSPGAGTVKNGDGGDLEKLHALLTRGLGETGTPVPYLNERRQLRLYSGKLLFIIKPSELRYWTRSAGLNDADDILGDHWSSVEHAAPE